MTTGRRIRVRGQVQGVGFRPFVWQLATRMGLTGEVLNDPEGVLIHVAGADLDGFETALRAEAPLLARVDAVQSLRHDFHHPPLGFSITASTGKGAQTSVTPDAATCKDCLAEILDPSQRRFGYAFANCTQCGPRFSILQGLPYDRSQTSMAAFQMCADCATEYCNPGDRRFHAQPIACPRCGPRLWLEVDGEEIAGDAILGAAAQLRAGNILAIKGLGGFHLACDAYNAATIAALRQRKHRPAKPFALLGTAAMIDSHALVSDAERALLTGPAAPVVLLTPKGALLPEAIAPGMATHGWMLPSTPLHHLLLAAFSGPLVMTSGNLSGEPQVIGNDEARHKLGRFADGFLLHDRDIMRRLDDGVERILPSGPMILRRGRGRVPSTMPLPPGFEGARQILAYGGQMKSAICLIKDGRALLSHHLGDLDDAVAWEEFQKAEADYTKLFDLAPEIIACDRHPGYRASVHARQRAKNLPMVQVQHHHAHLAAAMGDAGWPRDAGPVAGIILDGMGLGDDGTIWGGEVLLGDYPEVARVTHLVPAPLPGGDAASRAPWRNLLARLDAAGLADLATRLLADRPLATLRQAIGSGLNAPQSSSAGRLFDAVAAALGLVRDTQSFEGEAAMALEALATGMEAQPYPFMQTSAGIDPAPMFHALAQDLSAGTPPQMIAARFHAGLARAFTLPARRLVESGRAQAVALSGGCFQNATLLRFCLEDLSGLRVLVHHQTPANDGGLAFGQALVAAARDVAGELG